MHLFGEMLMLWKDKYNIGVALIDEQHRELFRRVDDFLSVVRSDVSWENKVGKVNETLEFMKEYVVTHFRDEEEYQRSVGYPSLDSHRDIHDGMVRYVVEVADQYEREGCREQLMQQFAGRLLAWLINHVASEDQKIAQFVKNGAAGEGRSND